MTANDIIASSLTNAQRLLHRWTDDLSPAEFLHRPTEKANCTAWLIGHLTLGDRNSLTRMGVKDLPVLPEDEKRFSRDEGCPQAANFGEASILLPLFDAHRNLLIETVKRAAPALLDQPVEKPLPMFNTIGEMLAFMALHNAMHAGQITIIRRSLGRPPVI